MSGKIIVTAPDINMGLLGHLKVYINGVLQERTLRRRETAEYYIEGNSEVYGKYMMELTSSTISVSDNEVSEIQFDITKGTFKSTMDIKLLKKTPMDSSESMVEKPILFFDGGVGDKLEVYEDRIIIKHKGVLNFMAMGVHGDKTIYYSDLTAIQFKYAGTLSGHIQFSVLGGKESTGGVLSASSDENTITFVEGKNDEAKKIYEYLNDKLREIKSAKNTPVVQVASVSAADELKKFKELLDMGIITQEEFDAKKKQLLGL